MAKVAITSPAMYALYWLAINRPEVIVDALHSEGSVMLANDQHAAEQARNILDRSR